MTDPDHIRAWQRLGPDLTTSGRLTSDDLARLAELGVRHVINLALDTHPEALESEAERLAACGIGYSHIPVPFDAPGEDHFAAFAAAFDAAPRPLHVHCIMNWRVSAFLCRYNRDVAGMDEAEARALMARQWDPAVSDHPDAPVWARFVGGEQD